MWETIKKHPTNRSEDKESYALFFVPDSKVTTKVRPVYIKKGATILWGKTLRALGPGEAILAKCYLQAPVCCLSRSCN